MIGNKSNVSNFSDKSSGKISLRFNTDTDFFSWKMLNKENESLLSLESMENNYEDDDLEIPAFLRRQKN